MNDSIDYGNARGNNVRRSGRAVIHKKATVLQAVALDITALHRAGLFRANPGQNATAAWGQDDNIIARIECALESGAEGSAASVRLRFGAPLVGQADAHTQVVAITSTTCNFGGTRSWFLCPNCARRCRILYLPYRTEGRQFSCRQCCGLTYDSRQRHRDRFYEHVLTPMRQLESVQRSLQCARTAAQREALWERGLPAMKSIARYDARSTQRLCRALGEAQLAAEIQQMVRDLL